jgi:hypothetical protein
MGAELATEWQTISGAVGQLGVNLATLGCEFNDIDASTVKGAWQSDTLYQGTGPFTRAVRLATRAIIFRTYTIDPIPLNHPSMVSTEGADFSATSLEFINQHAAYIGEKLNHDNARLLARFRGGLALRGYSQRASSSDMRQEFDEILDSLWTHDVDHHLAQSRFVEQMMSQAGLRDLGSMARSARRVQNFAQHHGLLPGLRRISPASFMPRLPGIPSQK